ncbi:MAG: hypothetical protein HKN50_09860 [Gammaproteobacteria bacterium]|nr:hypothetical protein [Gammaproteobacteria bacterium]
MGLKDSGLAAEELRARIMMDISIGVGVASFAVAMWGVPTTVQLAKAVGIGALGGMLCFLILALVNEALNYLFPQRRKSRRRSKSRKSTEAGLGDISAKPAQQSKTSKVSASHRQRTHSQQTHSQLRHSERTHSSQSVSERSQSEQVDRNSVTEVSPRTVSIASGPKATPPFPKAWSEELIETLEWQVFDNLCIAFWEAQGNRVTSHSKGSSDAANFFISAKNRPDMKIGVVQSRSSQANKASVIEMKNLLRLKKDSDLPISVFMYAGRISNVVSSFCQSHGIRLFGAYSINKGLHALPPAKQEQLLKNLIKPDYMIPTCPNCDIKMVKRKRRDTGRIFWGCLSYPECRETIEYSPYY